MLERQLIYSFFILLFIAIVIEILTTLHELSLSNYFAIHIAQFILISSLFAVFFLLKRRLISVQNQLLEQQKQLAEAQIIGKMGAWTVNLKTKHEKWTAGLYRLFGVAEHETPNFDLFLQRVYPEDQSKVTQCWNQAQQQGFYDIKYRVLVNNKLYWVHDRAQIRYCEFEKANIAVGVVQDITESQLIESALQKREFEILRIFQRLPFMIAIVAIDTRLVLETNELCEKITGRNREDVINKTPEQIGWHSNEETERLLSKFLNNGYLNAEPGIAYHKEGHPLDVLYYAEPVKFRGNACVLVVIQDVTCSKKIEQALRESEHHLSTLIEALPDAIFFKDGKGRWQVLNSAAETLFDLQGHAWKGKTDIELGEMREGWREVHQGCVQGDELAWQRAKITKVEEIIQTKQGNTYYFDVTKIPLFLPNGERHGLVIIGRDVTERRLATEALRLRLEEQQLNERRLRQLGDSLPNGIIYQLIHQNGQSPHFSYISAGVERLFGLKASTVQQDASTFYSLIEENDLHVLQEAEAYSARTLTPLDQAFRQRPLNGELRWVHCRAMPQRLADNSVLWNGIIFDITELIHTREAAETASQAKSIFLASMSHELRTPLNAILGFAQLIEQDSLLSERQHSYAQNIQRSGEHLLTLINDILDLTKIEAGHFEIVATNFNLLEFIHYLKAMIQLRAEQKNIEFKIEYLSKLPEVIVSDSKRLQQILVNLLSNAVKFTERGTVTLRIGFSLITRNITDTQGILYIEVADTGIGIATAQLDKIFEPFIQVGEGQYNCLGTGLGLTITHRLVEAMGGSLRVESLLGKGSVFYLRLPIETAQASDISFETQAKIIAYHRTAEQNIAVKEAFNLLIIGEITDNQQTIEKLLTELGFNIRFVKSGWEGLDMLAYWKPDLILLAIQMSEIDGLETARIIRVMRGYEIVPIIAISNALNNDEWEACLRAGCNAHLRKPIDNNELFSTLKTYLPLVWQYQTDNNPKTIENTPHYRLNLEQRQQVLKLVKRGAISDVLNTLETLAKQTPSISDEDSNMPSRNVSEAAILLKLAQRFRLQEIQQLLER